jgi:hypothetical protein
MVLVTKCTHLGDSKSVDPQKLNPEKQIFLNWGDQYLKWHNKYFQQELNPKLVTDSTLLSFDLLDQDSWLIVPLSAAHSLKEKFRDIYIVPFNENPPHRAIYMITNKTPLYSNREAIEDFKALVDKHMDAHRIWQDNQ